MRARGAAPACARAARGALRRVRARAHPTPPPPTPRRTLLFHSRATLRKLFGYEVVSSMLADTEYVGGRASGKKGGSLMPELLEAPGKATFVTRLHKDAAGKAGRGGGGGYNQRMAAHAVSLMMGEGGDRRAARRGLLVACYTMLLGAKGLALSEAALFALLGKLDDAMAGTGGKGGSDLPDWRTIVKDDFVKAG
jgi:hypothetical protein